MMNVTTKTTITLKLNSVNNWCKITSIMHI